MRQRSITDEQLVLLDKLVKEGKSNDEMYPLVQIKFSTLLMWKKRLKEVGLEKLLVDGDKKLDRRRQIIKILNELDLGGEYFVEDNAEFTSASLVVSMYNLGKVFSKTREAVGWRLKRIS